MTEFNTGQIVVLMMRRLYYLKSLLSGDALPKERAEYDRLKRLFDTHDPDRIQAYYARYYSNRVVFTGREMDKPYISQRKKLIKYSFPRTTINLRDFKC